VTRFAKDGKTFPAWEYPDIDVSLARNPQNRLFLTFWREYTVDLGIKTLVERLRNNVWAHAQDARTYFPAQDIPVGVDPTGEKVANPLNRGIIDGKIEIVTVMLFRYDTLYSVPPDFETTVSLLAGLNQEILKPIAVGQKRLVTTNGIIYPVWDFNNIDVSAARDPRNKYFFMIDAASSEGQSIFGTLYSNIWVHGADGRTYFPTPDVPERGCP
jgi:hypothetical protein